MSVTLNEQDLKDLKNENEVVKSEIDNTYNTAINDYMAKNNELIDSSKKWVEEQKRAQEESYGLQQKELENQAAQTEKDYIKEQSAAYKDYQKQSNQYGVEAERQASIGLRNSGYSESSQVSMYTAWQNRVAVARAAMVSADTQFKLAIAQAKAQNDVALAEIAYKGYQEQLSLAIDAMNYKNSLLIQKTSEKRAVDSEYYNRWLDLYQMLKAENGEDEIEKDSNVKFYDTPIGPTAPTQSIESDNGNDKAESKYKVDMASVYALGYGANITPARLNSLIKLGEVVEIVNPITGIITYKKVDKTLSNNSYLTNKANIAYNKTVDKSLTNK